MSSGHRTQGHSGVLFFQSKNLDVLATLPADICGHVPGTQHLRVLFEKIGHVLKGHFHLSVPSTVLFHAQLTTQPAINSSINHRKSSDDGHNRAIQHHRWCLPLPPQQLRPSILPRSQRNSLRGSTKMGWWWVGGWSCSLAKDVLGLGMVNGWHNWPPTGLNRFNERSRGRGSIGECNNQLWVKEMVGGRHNNYSLSPGPIRGN
jgi:hypothetical protein